MTEGTIEFGTKAGAKLSPLERRFHRPERPIDQQELFGSTALAFENLFQNENRSLRRLGARWCPRFPAQDGIEIMRILDAGVRIEAPARGRFD